MGEELYLIYVHEFGVSYKHKHQYEFLFSTTLEGVDGEGWDSYPASGNPLPPYSKLISDMGTVFCDDALIVAQNNEQFSMWDAVDGVMPLAWEDIEGLDEYPSRRLVFPFGMKRKDVKALLYERDITITFEKKITHNE